MQGLEWGGPDAVKERSGAPLIEAMVVDAKACSELQRFVISASGFELPRLIKRIGKTSAFVTVIRWHVVQLAVTVTRLRAAPDDAPLSGIWIMMMMMRV